MRLPKILITSAGGKTGMPTALQLLEKGYPVRAFVRRDDRRTKILKQAGAEIFIGDQFTFADMRRAMTGIQRAYLCAPTAANLLHFGAVFALAAHEAKLEHVVTLSQWLAHPDHISLATREAWFNDELAKLLPDTTVTINNAGWFADNYFMVLEPIAQLGLMPMPLGPGDTKGNAPPSNEDIAAVNVGALIAPELHAGKVYRPTGPKLLSPNQIAAIFSKVLGRKVTYQNMPEAMFLKALKAMGISNFFQTQIRYYADEYRRGTFAIHAPTTAVRDVASREPEDFETIVQRYVATRPEAIRNFGNKLKAIANFMGILLTTKPDVVTLELKRDHVLLEHPTFAQSSGEWRQSHDPQAGYISDHPAIQERFSQR